MPTETFVWVNTPGNQFVNTPSNEFVNAQTSSSVVIYLCNPRAVNVSTRYRATKNVSTIYRAKRIVGGVIMLNEVNVVRIGHGDIIKLVLQGERVDTKEIVDLTPAQMADIKRVRLVLGPGVIIDTNSTGAEVGAGKEFDNVAGAADATLNIKLGKSSQAASLAGNSYEFPHMDVYFTAADTDPQTFYLDPFMIIADDA